MGNETYKIYYTKYFNINNKQGVQWSFYSYMHM